MKNIKKNLGIVVVATLVGIIALKIFSAISWLMLFVLLLTLPIIIVIIKMKINGFKLDSNLSKLAKSIQDRINVNIDYCIGNAHGYKTDTKNYITLTHYFNRKDLNNWDSGVQLCFDIIDNKLSFRKSGFGFRNDKYNTTENNTVLDKLILDVESIKI